MLSFLSPIFLTGALAAAVPIVLHLLKREPASRVKWAVVHLLKRAPVERTDKHRLRELLLLALRVATLVLFALAFARPFFASGEALPSASPTVVALDTSFSMSAPGRFERARALAKAAVERAPGGSLVGVVTFADEAQIAAKPSVDRVLAEAAIDQAAPGFGATRYRSALSAATQSLPGRTGTIVIVTDLQESGWDAGDRAPIPEGVRIDVVDVGPPPPNLAVIAVRKVDDRVEATIRNSSPHARDARAHLTVDGRPSGEATASPGPDQTAEVAFPAPRQGTVAAVSLDDPDGIQADNVRYALLVGTVRPRVLIVTAGGDPEREGFYVRHALSAGERDGRGYAVDIVRGVQLSTLPEERLADYAAALLVSTRGLERRGREALAAYVRRGGGLVVPAGPDVDGEVAGDVLGPGATLRIRAMDDATTQVRALAPSDVRHPVFQPFAGAAGTLALVHFRKATRIQGSGCETLARFTNGDAALIECASGEGRALVIASDLDNRWNDFPLHASFVPFMHEAVRYVSSARMHASEYVVGDAPAGVPRTPGVHSVDSAGDSNRRGSRPGAPPRRIVVNVDPRESDPARITVEEFQSVVTRLKDDGAGAGRMEARQQEDRQHLWRYALALMAMTLAVEGYVASRTA